MSRKKSVKQPPFKAYQYKTSRMYVDAMGRLQDDDPFHEVEMREAIYCLLVGTVIAVAIIGMIYNP